MALKTETFKFLSQGHQSNNSFNELTCKLYVAAMRCIKMPLLMRPAQLFAAKSLHKLHDEH